jgi:hypothetical protein
MAPEPPKQIELCLRCLGGLVFRLTAGDGKATMPYCVKCGGREPGQIYVREDAASKPTEPS